MSEIDEIKRERAEILRQYSRHEITAAEAIKQKNELDDRLLKAMRKERKK